MLRLIAPLCLLCALAMVLAVSFGAFDSVLPEISGPDDGTDRLITYNNGEPVTLESIQKDIDWHRETAQKLRALH